MPSYSSTQLVNAMKNRVKKFATKDVPQASSVAGKIYGNVRQNKLRGGDLRLMRGGFGDALLNTDKPEPRLVQKQMGMVQRAAAKDNLTAAAGVAGAPKAAAAGGRFVAATGRKVLRDRATGKFVSANALKRFFRK